MNRRLTQPMTPWTSAVPLSRGLARTVILGTLLITTAFPAHAACGSAPAASTDGALRLKGTPSWNTVSGIGTAAAGDMVYDTTNNVLSVCDGTSWNSVSSGGSGSTSDRITSGTTNVTVNSASTYISFTTAGVVSNYIDNLGRIITSGGVSATAPISATAGYFSGNVGISTTNPIELLSLGNGGKLRLVDSAGTYGTKIYNNSYTWTVSSSGAYGPSQFNILNLLNWNDSGYIIYAVGGRLVASGSIYASATAALGFETYSGTSTYNAIKAVYTDNNTDGLLFQTKASGVDTERMRITSAGNVGIGTQSPTAALQVSGTFIVSNSTQVTTPSIYVSTGAGYVGIGTNNPSYPLHVTTSGLASNGAAGLGVDATFTPTNATTMYGTKLSATQGSGGSAGGTMIGLSAAGTANGSSKPGTMVGLGTATNNINAGTISSQVEFQTGPAVYGSATTSSLKQIEVRDVYTNSGAGTVGTQYGLYVNALTGAGTNYSIYTGGSTQSYFGGNVGIGTTNPTAKVQVSTSINTTALILDGSNYSAGGQQVRLDFTNGGSAHTYSRIANETGSPAWSGDLVFATNPGTTQGSALYERMRITNSGNVGIGTSTPSGTLHISGTAFMSRYAAQPVACSGSYNGLLAMTSTARLCACDGSSWKYADGTGNACSW